VPSLILSLYVVDNDNDDKNDDKGNDENIEVRRMMRVTEFIIIIIIIIIIIKISLFNFSV
jgi:uncharacterized membrane protein YvbJ